MLERTSLLLRPWLLGPSSGDERIWIIDPLTQSWLGSACRPLARGFVGRLRSWARPRIAVREADDEPLLFTMSRGLIRRSWQVCDADGDPIGRIRGLHLNDRNHRQLATLRRSSAEQIGHYETRSGEILATIESGGEGVLLSFQEPSRDEPFLRMAVLAGTLAHCAPALTGFAALECGPRHTR